MPTLGPKSILFIYSYMDPLRFLGENYRPCFRLVTLFAFTRWGRPGCLGWGSCTVGLRVRWTCPSGEEASAGTSHHASQSAADSKLWPTNCILPLETSDSKSGLSDSCKGCSEQLAFDADESLQ